MKHNRELLQEIHDRIFNGIDVLKEVNGNSYAIVETLVEYYTMMILFQKHNFLPFFHKDRDDNTYVSLYDEIATFYANNPRLANDELFILRDDYFNVDFNIIVDSIEEQVREQLKES